jgi:hypothetical protein
LEKIFSRINPTNLLHINYSMSDLERQEAPRVDLSDNDEFLQISSLKIDENKSFKPHKHLTKKTDYDLYIAQESWVVIVGKVSVNYFDIDDSLICNRIITRGDMSITFRGGHSYQAIEGEALVYEFKSGPYRGAIADKAFIEYSDLK